MRGGTLRPIQIQAAISQNFTQSSALRVSAMIDKAAGTALNLTDGRHSRKQPGVFQSAVGSNRIG